MSSDFFQLCTEQRHGRWLVVFRDKMGEMILDESYATEQEADVACKGLWPKVKANIEESFGIKVTLVQ